jgi:hypothetical protein
LAQPEELEQLVLLEQEVLLEIMVMEVLSVLEVLLVQLEELELKAQLALVVQ